MTGRFKTRLALCFLALLLGNALATERALAQTTAGREPPFMPLRFMEDVRAYCEEPEDTVGIDLKCLRPRGPDGPIVSFGGELKWKFEAARSPGFGFAADDVVYPLQRVLVHADARLTPNVRAFVQIGHHVRYGSDTLARPSDESDVDLQQGFVDLFWRKGPDDGWVVRLGRQELGFGSTRFVGAREGANLRLSFDAALVSWQSPNRHRVDVFAGRPMANSRGAFDDSGDDERAFWGVYTTTRLWGQSSFPERPADQALSLDLYYLGFENERARFRDGVGAEQRAAFGARLFGRVGDLDLDWEAQVQRGRLAASDIRAWTIATDTGWTFPAATWSPRLGLRADIASGDATANDGELGSLQPLFASPAYFSEAALVGPVNLMSLNPHVTLTPRPGVRLQAGWNALWKAEAADAFYRPGPVAVPGTAGGERRIGHQSWVGLSASLTRNLTVSASVVHFEAGPAVTQGGGEDVDYATVSLKTQF